MTGSIRRNNFDFLRILLAVLVVRCHAILVGWSLPWTDDPFFLGGRFAVQCFFVISGYLIFRSWDYQPHLAKYLEKRARRIFPAYAFVILVCTITLSLLSTLAVAEYFTDSRVYAYLVSNLAFLGFLQNTLPGVFENNFTSYVNGPLWTIKIEVMFYLSVPVIEYLSRRCKRSILFALIYIAAIGWNVGFGLVHLETGREVFERVSEQLPGQMSFFIAGGSLHFYRDLFARHLRSACVAAVVVVFAYFGSHGMVAYVFYPFALAIVVIGIANHFYYLGNFGRFGDFSYGMYIFHYPIFQVLAALNLSLSPPLLFAMGFTLSLLASIASWHFLESYWLLPSSHYVKASR